MSGLHEDDIKAIVVETLNEQQRFRRDDIDAIVLRTVATTLTSFGIEEEDRRELRADLQHLRRWRKSVEQAQSYTFKAVVTVIATGLVGAVWLGVKVVLGK
jgi:NADPH-dependent glutamate synthase beta subunit-like oxidoreductase